LQGANLKNANIQYALVGRANLKNADLSEANLFGSRLLWADFSNTKLYRVNLSRTLMSRVNLQGADLYGANLEYSILRYADLQNSANLRQTKLKGVNFQNAYFSSVSQLQRGKDWEKAFIDLNWQQKITQSRKIPKIALVIPSNDSIFQSYLEGMRSVSGIEVITINSGPSVEQEAKAIADLIQQGVDGILVRPQDPDTSVPALKKAFDQGIIPINIGDCINRTAIKRFVFGCYESDSIKMGYDSTEALIEYMKRKYPGQVINVGLVDGTRAGRVYPYFQGFKQAMAKSGVQWQEVASTDAIDKIDISIIKKMVQAYPQINVIWSGSDATTDATVQAIQQLGLGTKIKVFGMMDLTPEKAKMLQDPQNPLQSIIDQSPTQAGKEATERILQVLRREKLEYEYHSIPHKLMSNSD
jgi:ABC-type sugar transport system substrate-binding protein